MNAPSLHDTDRWLSEHTHLWVESGLLSDEQARAILATEQQSTAELASTQKLPLFAELFSYLGIVLVAESGAFVVVRSWDALGAVGRLAVGVVVAVLGLLGGRLVLRLGGDAAERLGGFLWVGGTAGIGLTAGVLAVQFGSNDEGVTGLTVALAVLAISAFLWRNLERRPLQFLTTVGGLVASVAFLLTILDVEPPMVVAGVAIWTVSVLLGLLAVRGIVRPETYALVVGGIGAVEGMLAVGTELRAVGLLLAVATAVGVLLVGLWRKHMPVIVLGVLTFLMTLGQLLGTYLRGVGSALVILVLGMVAVAVAIIKVREGRRPTL